MVSEGFARRVFGSCSSLALALLWLGSCGRVETTPSATDGGSSSGTGGTSSATDGGTSSDATEVVDADAREGWHVSPASDAAAAEAREACGRYAAAMLAFDVHKLVAPRCGGLVLPADEAARVTQRLEQACLTQVALPGSGMTPAAIEACAAALELSSCDSSSGLHACDFRGSLPGGAYCNEDIQCQSGWCQGTVMIPPGGPVDPYTCGTCAPVAKLGEVCGSASCEINAVCMTNDTMAPSPTYTCVAVTEGDVGASCDRVAKVCKLGLYCDGNTSLCAELGDLGATCGEGPSARWAGGCKPPLICAGSPFTCREPLPEGAPCDPNALFDCAAGLFCFATTSECTAVSSAGPGERCSEIVWCLVGTCITTEYVGGIATGTCPALIPDGAPCDVPDPGATCDVFAECFQGTCQLPGGLVCN